MEIRRLREHRIDVRFSLLVHPAQMWMWGRYPSQRHVGNGEKSAKHALHHCCEQRDSKMVTRFERRVF
jgi:hypothetical protein